MKRVQHTKKPNHVPSVVFSAHFIVVFSLGATAAVKNLLLWATSPIFHKAQLCFRFRWVSVYARNIIWHIYMCSVSVHCLLFCSDVVEVLFCLTPKFGSYCRFARPQIICKISRTDVHLLYYRDICFPALLPRKFAAGHFLRVRRRCFRPCGID